MDDSWDDFNYHYDNNWFDILYYENGRDNGDLPVVVWEATGEGMHATQIFLDIGFSGASSVVRQTGTTTGGMAWV